MVKSRAHRMCDLTKNSICFIFKCQVFQHLNLLCLPWLFIVVHVVCLPVEPVTAYPAHLWTDNIYLVHPAEAKK